MRRTLFLCVVALLFAAALCENSEETRTVCTHLDPEGYSKKDYSEDSRRHFQEGFKLPYKPVYIQNHFARGNHGWKCGNDLFMLGSHQKEKYGFVFLHGAGMTTADPTIKAFVGSLLDEFGGRSAVPQALPGFSYAIFGPEHAGDPIEEGVNGITAPSYSSWTNLEKGPNDILECYAKPTPYDAMWDSITNEHYARISKFIQDMVETGIPPKNIYVLGFSIGAIMSHHVLVRAASEGMELGGAVGFDGGHVNRIGSREIYKKIQKKRLNSLYLMYSNVDEVANSCLEGYPGFSMQLYTVKDKADIVPHAVYQELLPSVVEWIRAPIKEAVSSTVKDLWEDAMKRIRHPTLII